MPPGDATGIQKQLLQHAERAWKAEEANATRIAAKANVVATGITGTLGFKLFVLGKAAETISHWRLFPILGTSAAVLVTIYLLWSSLRLVLGTVSRKPNGDKENEDSPPAASWYMTIYEGELPEDATEEEAVAIVTAKLQRASASLQLRNEARKEDVEEAEKRFFAGFSIMILSTLTITAIVVLNQ